MGDKTTIATSATRPLEGKLGIISGASRGIGAAVAHNLASKGCSLILNYTSASSAEQTATLASTLSSTHGITAVPVRADVSGEAGCAAIIAAAQAARPEKLQVDVLINNAAVTVKSYLGSIDADEFARVYKTNVLGPILLTQAALPFLPHDRSGRIVNMSSVVNSQGMVGYSVYGGSKGALEAMTRVWARELAERATVNTVNIGPTMTDMYLGVPPELLKEVLESWMPACPLSAVRDGDTEQMKTFAQILGGRPGYVEEVAGVVGMLCLPEAGWTTGGLNRQDGAVAKRPAIQKRY
ncbi:putative short chain dehydrogenase protein [Neofusicoccum parvum UCRNP2]|uniref:Putative short chain dehydrogenase protein n=1 Tax=Botryosphaeria parva (strain UCR-NP2) TaxID=1287680 RepID=R1GIH8_BOTPV|nr:putative short chain dehydrogenase protein [Neofusicoccum parvum UCRNP2]